MAKKKEETVEETTDAVAEETVEEKPDAKAEKVTKKSESKAKTSNEKEAKADTEESVSLIDSVVDAVSETVSNVAEVVAETASDVADVITETASSLVEAVTGSDEEEGEKTGKKRAEKVGIVFSDKMTKTVVVRVNRMVKHQLYHKYMKRRKKFMAHDEMGAAVGDRVRIQETRPLSARKRWRVIEIIQKAEK